MLKDFTDISTIDAGGSTIALFHTIKLFCVTLDENINFNDQVNKNNSTAGAVQVEANLYELLSDYLQFLL